MFNHKTMWYSKGQRHRVLIMLLCALTLLPLSAQNPTWVKKTAPAVFTLKTFRADGSLLSSTNGFFISETGEAVSSFAPFKGAQRAVVIDAQGKEWPVECIIGGNDMYDVAKFKVRTVINEIPENGVLRVGLDRKGTIQLGIVYMGSTHVYYSGDYL